MSAALQLFRAEVASPKASHRSLAVCYALLISQHSPAPAGFWKPINDAVNERLGLKSFRQIDTFRKVAWLIVDAAVAASPELPVDPAA